MLDADCCGREEGEEEEKGEMAGGKEGTRADKYECVHYMVSEWSHVCMQNAHISFIVLGDLIPFTHPPTHLPIHLFDINSNIYLFECLTIVNLLVLKLE